MRDKVREDVCVESKREGERSRGREGEKEGERMHLCLCEVRGRENARAGARGVY